MRNYNLGFISDANVFKHVKETAKKYRFGINLAEFNKNIIDPVKLTFDTKIYNKTIKDVVEAEIIRQLDKSNTNHIGYFHQNIFKYIGDGDWYVLPSGFDIANDKLKIYAEMKNKHNTMNSSSSQKTYMRMQAKLIKESAATCMLVEVIATKSQNIKWSISLDGVNHSNDNIRRVSIDQFYMLVTGDKFAFKKLCEKLPIILEDVVASISSKTAANTVFTELEKISPNLSQSLYLLAFKKYQGFDNFNL